MDFQFTRRELDCLLKLRRKPRSWECLRKASKTDDDGLNIMLSRMEKLWYTKDGKAPNGSLIHLNQIGETVAQAEFDRRFDMYFTRVMALSALLVSIASFILISSKIAQIPMATLFAPRRK